VGLRAPPVKNVNDGRTLGDENIGDDSPMTAPPQNLGAHDGGPESLRQKGELTQRCREFFAHGIVGVALKCSVTPGGVSAV
jgi:hypothetical protein